MPWRRRPLLTAVALLSTNAFLVCTVEPVYNFVCNHPAWERRRVRRQAEKEREELMRRMLQERLSQQQQQRQQSS
ncbi:hypothetical protein KFL_001610210 [Klebsormidium nitens]|uniref:Uncharacterized protein n=1 Tax=Klebsormidium nitens TaxID=105231 RepID=A0A1Y1HYP4_KLENI|nr:hypothetical protein KFL_001610210 [Klebsormidium nitens]|eukprot:GAQ83780.1 hypothetical protein KFL_001610210 [Klebsormidium nitens]